MVKNLLSIIFILSFIFACSDGTTDPGDDFGDIKKPGVIRIGLVNDVNDTATLTRLTSLASNTTTLDSLGITEFTITEITSAIDPDSLSQFTIIYLPVGWASALTTTYENINANGSQYMSYVENGGGLFIEQPNPHTRPDNTITIEFLPYPLTLTNGYINEEVTVIDSTHYITSGIGGIDLPFPGDQAVDLPEEYTLLAQGTTSGAPSLFVLNHGTGKILFAMGHPNPAAIHPYSDEVYYRMLHWLTLGN